MVNLLRMPQNTGTVGKAGNTEDTELNHIVKIQNQVFFMSYFAHIVSSSSLPLPTHSIF